MGPADTVAMTPSPPPPPVRALNALGVAHGPDDDAKDRPSVQWHPWYGPAADTLRHVPGPQAQARPQLASSHAHRIATDLPPQVRLAVLQQRLDAIDARQAQLRRGRITSGQTLALGVKVALQSATRELGTQLAGQGTQMAVRALLIGYAQHEGTGRWAAPGAAAVVMLGAGVYFGGRTVRALAQGALVPDSRAVRRLLVGLPVAVDIGAVTAAALGGGIGSGVRVLAGIAARMTGHVAGAVVAQAQGGLWGGLRLVTPHGDRVPATRIAAETDPLRLVMAVCLYALGCLCFLVLLTPHLAGAFGGDPHSNDFGELVLASQARAVSVAVLEVLHAFLEVIVQAAAALQAGLACAYEPGRAGALAANLCDWRGTWERIRDYAGVRIWLGSFASDLPSALATAFAADAGGQIGASLAAARAQVLMASRGWILQQPGQVAALAQERRWQQLEAGIEAASVQLAAAWQSGDEPPTVRIRLPAAPAQPAFDVVFGREDGQLTFEPAG